MSFGHRFGGEKSFAHCVFLSVIRLSDFTDVFSQRNKKSMPQNGMGKRVSHLSRFCAQQKPKAMQEVAPCHIDRLPGIFGPVPSASLDKLDCIQYTTSLPLCQGKYRRNKRYLQEIYRKFKYAFFAFRRHSAVSGKVRLAFCFKKQKSCRKKRKNRQST